MISIPLGHYFELIITWMTDNWSVFFKGVENTVESLIDFFEMIFFLPHPYLMIAVFAGLAWWATGWRKYGLALFTVIGYLLIMGMGLWERTMQTLALVLVATFIALLVGVPVGIWSGRRDSVERVVRPILDFMQTMPAFVYLIPAVFFFSIGKVPGAVATVVFAMPPCVRLTTLGLKQVPHDVLEASDAFGCTPMQQLFKVQLPMALPSILAGVNQTIMLALSMVVIAALIGAGGLGAQVVRGVQQLRLGLGFESGIAIVVLAMYLDRITHALGSKSARKQKG